MPLRPIVSFCGSPLYNLSKFLQNILKPLTSSSEFSIKNSYDMANLLRDATVPSDCVMVSFDVVNLFGSIPQELAV